MANLMNATRCAWTALASTTRSRQALLLTLAISLTLLVPRRCAATDLSGCWEGCWKSCTSGHDGVLRATFEKLDENRYCAHFSGTFYRVLPFRYSVVLNTKQEEDVLKLEGSSYLGRLFGGTFTYQGTASDTEFNASYSSCRDSGTFQMTRSSCCCRPSCP
jgi:hypothetical protein